MTLFLREINSIFWEIRGDSKVLIFFLEINWTFWKIRSHKLFIEINSTFPKCIFVRFETITGPQNLFSNSTGPLAKKVQNHQYYRLTYNLAVEWCTYYIINFVGPSGCWPQDFVVFWQSLLVIFVLLTYWLVNIIYCKIWRKSIIQVQVKQELLFSKPENVSDWLH